MTRPELRFAARLLKIASGEFGHHGCNDTDEDLLDCIPESMRAKMAYAYEQYNSGGAEEAPEFMQIPDYAWMGYMAHLLEKEANEK